MKVEPFKLQGKELHDFFTGLVVPRPIAFISTVNAAGKYNAAPFSAFQRLTLDPPVLVLAFGRRKGQKKDTVNNIEAVGDFVVNMVSEDLAQAMKKTAADYPPEVDEIREAGLTALKSDLIKSPRIAESPISMECRLMQTIEFGGKTNRSTIVLGEILLVHIRDEILTDGKTDPLKAKIIGRMGEDNLYCRTTDIFQMR